MVGKGKQRFYLAELNRSSQILFKHLRKHETQNDRGRGTQISAGSVQQTKTEQRVHIKNIVAHAVCAHTAKHHDERHKNVLWDLQNLDKNIDAEVLQDQHDQIGLEQGAEDV